MLHILWMIIKFILIVLGILLGLLLLAILLLLFCPVRYRASASKKGPDLKKVKADAAVSWLFHGIAVRVHVQDGQADSSIRILGIPLEKLIRKRKKKMEPPSQEEPSDAKVVREEKQIAETNPQIEAAPAPPGIPSGTEDRQMPEPILEVPDQSGEESRIWRLIRAIMEKLKDILSVPVRLIKKLLSIPGILMEKFRKIALTFRNVYDKIDWWKQFVSHPRTQEAISLIFKHAKGVLKHVLPTKVEGQVTFGSEDPSVTGAILAALGITIPFHKNCIAVNPLFDGENFLEADIRLKGRIYGWVFLKAAIEIYFNKNVKYVINRWKHKEG